MVDAVGEGEGELNVLAWPGYAESGKNYPEYDWVTPFEKKTGCKANVKEFGTSDEAVSLMHAGGYDVVSASGDATLRLIAAGDVQPVNTDLVPDYADMSPFLKETDYNSVDGQMWGIPHGWGANLLAYNKDVVKPAPTDWGAVFDGASDYAGKVTAYDNPIYIADAALYLMETQPDLGIENPYALDQDQLDAAVDVLKEQNEHIGEYWTDYTKESQAFKTGSSVLGTTWEYTASISGPKTETVFPDSGSTGWSDTWMVAADTDHVNCAYMWLDWMATPETQAEVASSSARPRPTRRPATSRPRGSATSTTRPTRTTRTRSGTGRRRSRSASTAVPTSSAPTTRTGPTPGPRSRADRASVTTASTVAGDRAAAAQPGSRRASAFLHRHAGIRVGRAGRCAAAVARADLPRRAAGAVPHGVLDRRLRRQRHPGLDPRQLPEAVRGRRLPHGRSSARSWSPLSVTVIDALLALPIAFYMAKIAGPAWRSCWSSRC